MGRRKIEIKPIRDDRNRSVTFLKRKGGLFKKAHELSVLCSVDVAVIIFGHNKRLYEYSSSDINDIVGRFQYCGGAHEHKGPADFADKAGGGDDDDDEDGGGEEGDVEPSGSPQPEHGIAHPQMQHHPGFQHVRHGTPRHPSASPPMHNGVMPQFVRGLSPLPPGVVISRPTSRAQQRPGHIRRTSSNLVPQHMQQTQEPPQQPSYAYPPNAAFYNPQAAAQMRQRPMQHGQQATYPPPFPPQPGMPPHVQAVQQAYMQDNRRSSLPPGYPHQPAPQANMQRPQSVDHLQPPGPRPVPSPQPQHGPLRGMSSTQPSQGQFASPPVLQPNPLPALAKQHSIFTPIDDSRSMLAQHWASTSNTFDASKLAPAVKQEGRPKSASTDVGVLDGETQAAAGRANGASPRSARARPPMRSPQRTASAPNVTVVAAPSRQNTGKPDAKRPRLNLQIPSEHSGDEGGGTGSTGDDTSTPQSQQAPQQDRVVLPPPSPSAGALLSAGAQGPRNPFARPAPPMSTNPHAMNRETTDRLETPVSALPSRFMSDNLLPSPSTFYPEWGFGRSGDPNMLPSPLNFQTPIVPNGAGWNGSAPSREDDKKRGNEDDGDGGGGGDAKRVRT